LFREQQVISIAYIRELPAKSFPIFQDALQGAQGCALFREQQVLFIAYIRELPVKSFPIFQASAHPPTIPPIPAPVIPPGGFSSIGGPVMKLVRYKDLGNFGFHHSRTHLAAMIKAGTFPPPRKLGTSKSSRIVWAESDLIAHQVQILRLAGRSAGGAA
jgi:hypothetical protein